MKCLVSKETRCMEESMKRAQTQGVVSPAIVGWLGVKRTPLKIFKGNQRVDTPCFIRRIGIEHGPRSIRGPSSFYDQWSHDGQSKGYSRRWAVRIHETRPFFGNWATTPIGFSALLYRWNNSFQQGCVDRFRGLGLQWKIRQGIL
jgi:hypothetical protein